MPMADLLAVSIAVLVTLGGWSGVAAAAGYFAHRRMRLAEAELGASAVPRDELPCLLMGAAWVTYPAAFVVALVGLVNRGWARLGRNATFVLLAQISAAVLSAIGAMIHNRLVPPSSKMSELLTIMIPACAMCGIEILIAISYFWIWAGRRAARLAGPPAEGPPPGKWRFAVYLASLVFWPVGLVSAAVFSKPENSCVGATALRCALVDVAAIAIGVCVGLPFLVSVLAANN